MARSFIILCPARSGSTLLRTALNRHPDICCHGELLGRNRILGYSRKSLSGRGLPKNAKQERDEDTVRFLQKYAFSAKAAVSGFKLLYYQVGETQFGEAIEHLSNQIDSGILKVISLWRSNLVLRCFSECLFVRPPSESDRVLTLSADFVAQDCRNQIALRRRLSDSFGLDSAYCVEYETLVREPTRCLDGICEYLGVMTGALTLPKKDASVPASAGTIHNAEALLEHPDLKRYLDYR